MRYCGDIRAVTFLGLTTILACNSQAVTSDSGPLDAAPDAPGDAPGDVTFDAPDTGVDASSTTYNDMTSSSFWSTFDTTTVNPNAYAGAAFDGRYVYFVPSPTGGLTPSTPNGNVMRYDTQASFSASASWSTFDTSTVNSGAVGFAGAAFDGRYVYLAPNPGSVAARYDTQASFTDGASWSIFGTTSVNSNANGFMGAAFDGRYVYFVPNSGGAGVGAGIVVRYDTQGSFTDGNSWSSFDAKNLSADAEGFIGAVFDGRYLYLVPYRTVDARVTRYDTQASFTDYAAWSMFAVDAVNPNAHGFAGGAFDGRYVYLVPNRNDFSGNGVVARYDTQASFTNNGSWSTFNVTTVNPNALGFQGAAFDGRYLYLVPWNNWAAFVGVVARYDTQASFTATGSWSTFDTATLNANAVGFFGAAFDGRYLYLVPTTRNGIVPRFDTKTPPFLPPGYAHGSFF